MSRFTYFFNKENYLFPLEGKQEGTKCIFFNQNTSVQNRNYDTKYSIVYTYDRT